MGNVQREKMTGNRGCSNRCIPSFFEVFWKNGKIRGYFIKFSHIYKRNYGMIIWYFGKTKIYKGEAYEEKNIDTVVSWVYGINCLW